MWHVPVTTHPTRGKPTHPSFPHTHPPTTPLFDPQTPHLNTSKYPNPLNPPPKTPNPSNKTTPHLPPHLDQVVQELHRILHIRLTVSTQPEHGVKHLTEKHDKALPSNLHTVQPTPHQQPQHTSAAAKAHCTLPSLHRRRCTRTHDTLMQLILLLLLLAPLSCLSVPLSLTPPPLLVPTCERCPRLHT